MLTLLGFASALGGNATLEPDVNYMVRQPLFGTTRMAMIADRAKAMTVFLALPARRAA